MTNEELQKKTEKVTRVEVIDHSASDFKGRCYVKYDAYIELDFQDGGRTLKIFTYDRPEELK